MPSIGRIQLGQWMSVEISSADNLTIVRAGNCIPLALLKLVLPGQRVHFLEFGLQSDVAFVAFIMIFNK